MKKFTLLMSLLTLLVVGLQARAADVYVETSDPTFNVYTWSPEDFGGWPGGLITDYATLTEVNGTQYYKLTLEGTGRFIIFNKDGVQTPNIPLQDGDNFFVYPKMVNGQADYSQYETSNPPIQITSYTIAGVQALMGVDWDPTATQNDMVLQADGTYKLVKEGVELTAGSYDYKVVGNHAWSIWEVPQQGNQTLTIAEDGKYNVTFTLTLGDENVLTAEAEKVEDVVIEHNYTIAGDEALMGSLWDINDAANLMAVQEDGTYKLVKEGVELTAGGYDYKVVRDHSWDWSVPVGSGNQTLTIAEDGKYNVTFTLTLGDENVLTANAELVGEPQPVEITSYTIVGVEALVGAEWNPEFAENDMVLQEDGTYKLVKENVELAAGGYDYKVVGNHTWQVWEVPMQGNQTLNIAEAGKYNVTFTLTLGEENVLTAEAELVGEPQPVEITSYTIVGVEALVGAEWNPEFAENDMVLQEDGTYKLVKENVELAAGDYDYKVVGNHTWQVWEVPMQGNQTLNIAEAGKYNVTFTLTLGEENVLTAEAVKNEVPQPEPNFVLHYGLNEEGAEWAQAEISLTEEANHYEVSVDFAENTEFVISDGDVWYGGAAAEGESFYLIHSEWCRNIPLATEGKVNFHINEAGNYVINLYVGENGITMDVDGFAVEPQPEPKYLLHYGLNEDGAEWADVEFVENEEGKLVATAEFAENTEFGILYGDTWYAGATEGGEYYLIHSEWCNNIPLATEGVSNFHINEAGTYTFTLTVGEEGITMDVAGFNVTPQPKYLLHYGLNEDGAEWADVEFAENEEGKLVATAEFAENTEFVINYGDLWYGGAVASEEEAYYLIHADWCTNIPLAAEGHKNFHINEAGTYTFTLTVGEEGITMDVNGFAAGVRGDITGDGVVDIADVNTIINMMLGKADKTAAADLTGDGAVDIADVNTVINIMAGK